MERKTRFELATLALARRCSTPEPLPHMYCFEKMVEGGGFEPPKAQLTDLQSAPFGHSGIPRSFSNLVVLFEIRYHLLPDKWSWWRESNPQPADYKSAALPLSHTSIKYLKKLATWNGLEPSTSSVTGWHSNQLNYQAIFNGGRNRARTYDPLLVRQVLSQLSYTPSHPFTTRELLYYTRARPECQVFFHNFFKFFRSSFSFRVFLSRTIFILTQVLIFVNNFFNFF